MTDTKAKRSRGKRVTPEARLIDSHVGKRLRDLRRLKGISQTELAEGVDLTFQQIQKYENGSNRVSLSMLVAIAKVLSYSPGHLARELLLGLEVANTDDIPTETGFLEKPLVMLALS
jgi:transcriptional regulator with XRE-family HTH domain